MASPPGRPSQRQIELRSIGFGIERLALPVVNRPLRALVCVVLASCAALAGATQMRFADDPAALFRSESPIFAHYEAHIQRFSDPADAAILLVEGDFRRPDDWNDLLALAGRLEAELGPERVFSVTSIARMEAAANAAAADVLDEPEHPAPAASPDGPTAEDISGHPLNGGRLLASDLRSAAIFLSSDPALAPLAAGRRLRDQTTAALATLPASLSGAMTGLPIIRAEIVSKLIAQQPLLLGGGLAIGFVLGVILLGSIADAAVIALMPALSILWIYGVFGGFGVRMTVLVNNLPLLVLALAFATSMHLVYAARRDLHAAAYDYRAVAGTMLRVGPAVVLSALTTAIAFLSFQFSGSEEIATFGLIGAAAVIGGLLTALLAQPAIIWAALKLGWRPVPPAPGTGRIARSFEAASVGLGRRIDRRRRPVALAAALLTVAAAAAFLQLRPSFSLLDDIPPQAESARLMERVGREFGGQSPLLLPLPISLDPASADETTLRDIRLAHAAAVDAFPGAYVLSPYSVLRWLSESGRLISAAALDPVFAAAPERFRNAIVSRDGRTPAVVVWARDTGDSALREAAGTLERAVGDAVRADLRGQATGLAVLAAERSGGIVTNLSFSLTLAAVGSAALVALAFGSAGAFVLALLPNLLPVLMVGAALFLIGRPIELASAMAMTVALGIAVDDTVHMMSSFQRHRTALAPRAALLRTMRELGPVLVTTTLVLSLGLAPALWSWSPGVALFAAFAIATLVIALVADLVVLPALLTLRMRRGGD